MYREPVLGEVEAMLHHTVCSVQDVVKSWMGAPALLAALDDETTFALWKELTSGEYYGR